MTIKKPPISLAKKHLPFVNLFPEQSFDAIGGPSELWLLRRNIELKARLSEGLDFARNIAQQIATDYLGIQLQADTYFHTNHGRLKLRCIEGQAAQLIWYLRPDQEQTKRSDYLLLEVDQAEQWKTALEIAWGTEIEVKKRREIFLQNAVRIHLDEVERLGTFLEFEAVLLPEQPDQEGHESLRELSDLFSIRSEHLLKGSYSDLLRKVLD